MLPPVKLNNLRFDKKIPILIGQRIPQKPPPCAYIAILDDDIITLNDDIQTVVTVQVKENFDKQNHKRTNFEITFKTNYLNKNSMLELNLMGSLKFYLKTNKGCDQNDKPITINIPKQCIRLYKKEKEQKLKIVQFEKIGIDIVYGICVKMDISLVNIKFIQQLIYISNCLCN